MYNSSISGIFRLFIVISLISLFVGCGGGGGGSSTPGGNTASSPTITSLTPTSGQVGDTVTITGTNFSTTLANNTVSFNGADAVVSSCTSTQIVTNVPVGATSGPIIVAVDGKSVKSSTNFTVNVSLPAFAASGLYDSGYFAFYWAGNNRTELYGGDTGPVNVYSITESGGTVYTAGDYYTSNNPTNSAVYIPCYWAGSTRTDLFGNGRGPFTLPSITVSGGTVYVAGNYFGNTNTIPCYWTGNMCIDLSSAGHGGSANSIAVSGGTVYTAGYYSDGTKNIPCYWTGTTRTDLPGADSGDGGVATSIAISGGTVYTAGVYSDGTNNIPCYWTGTTRTDLPVAGYGGSANSIAVSGGTAYTAGCYFDGTKNIPCYWNGTTRTDLPGAGTLGCGATSIAVPGSTVYTAGYYDDGINIIPCYWTGTTRTDLPGIANTNTNFGISVFSTLGE